MEDKTRKISTMGTLGVLAVFLLGQTNFIVNPALASLSDQYPTVPYSTILLVSTIPSLLAMFGGMFSGAVTGKKIGYRAMSLLSTAMLLLSGVLPFFIKGFYFLLVCRIIFGLGQGFSNPLGNALVMRIFPESRRASMLGVGNIVTNITGVVLQNVAGYVAVRNIDYVWLVHLAIAIPLILIMFMPEPAKEEVAEEQPEIKKEKSKLPFKVYLMSGAYCILFAVYYPFLLNMSSIMVGEGLGTAGTAGTILSLYTVGGMVSGAIFGKFFKIFKEKWTIPAALIIWTVSLVLGAFAKNVPLLMIASLLSGIAIFTVWSGAMMDFGSFLPEEDVTLASGVWVTGLALAGFAASPYVGIVSSITGSDDPRTPIFWAMIITIIITVIWTGAKIKGSNK